MTATAVVDSGQTPIARKVAAIAAETDPDLRAEMVAGLSYDEKMGVKSEWERAEDPIFRNLCVGVLEAAEVEDRRRTLAASEAANEVRQADTRAAAAVRARRWADLPPLVRGLHLAASDAPTAVAAALLELAGLLGQDTATSPPPESFV